MGASAQPEAKGRSLVLADSYSSPDLYQITIQWCWSFQKYRSRLQTRSVQLRSERQALSQLSRSVGQTLGPAPPLSSQISARCHPARPHQYRSSGFGSVAHHVETEMNSVASIDVGPTHRAEHAQTSHSRSGASVRGRIVSPQIGFRFHDLKTDPGVTHHGADQFGGHP